MRRMRRRMKKMPVALMMVNLVVRTFRINCFLCCFFLSNFHTFGAYFRYFLHVYKENLKILVCKQLDMMYTSIVQFSGCSTKLVEGQTMEKTELWWELWLKIENFPCLCQGA